MKGRFAPSPTGAMHLGNARTALLAWLQARRLGGGMILRIEDLDPLRVVAGAEARLLDELAWLGLDWDEGPDRGGPAGPYRQSERGALFDAAVRRLLDTGLAFECACSRAEIARAAIAPQLGDEPAPGEGPRYPGTCRDLPAGEAAARAAAAGRGTAIRFRGRGARVAFKDLVRGDVEPLGAEGLDDFVIRRSDGIAAYQLAVVVDDAAMGVTHVLRADDLLDSTPRQIALYRALGAVAPEFAHVPLVLTPAGERLAKRNRPVAIGDLRAAGAEPGTIVGALAASAGLCPQGARVRARDLVAEFDLARIAREAAVIDPATLAVSSTPVVGAGTSVVVRAAEGRDVIALAEVYVSSWRAAYRGIVPDAILDGLSVVAQTARWQKMLAGAAKGGTRAFVAETAASSGESAIRGFVVTGPVRGERPAGAPPCGEIWAIYFEPEAWRVGYGRSILAAAERDLLARGFPETVVWVLAKNVRARAFFEGLGWKSTGETRANAMGGEVVEEVRFHRGP